MAGSPGSGDYRGVDRPSQGISDQGTVGHEDVAPGRKVDPGRTSPGTGSPQRCERRGLAMSKRKAWYKRLQEFWTDPASYSSSSLPALSALHELCRVRGGCLAHLPGTRQPGRSDNYRPGSFRCQRLFCQHPERKPEGVRQWQLRKPVRPANMAIGCRTPGRGSGRSSVG